MTKEDKELLFKDLCGRLPYGVKVKYPGNETMEIRGIDSPSKTFSLVKWGEWNYTAVPICEAVWDGEGEQEFKPYLRPMSSMTEEEAFEMFHIVFHQVSLIGVDIESDKFRFKMVDGDGHFAGFTVLFFDKVYSLEQFDWLNKNMFDYRGLIPMGLALEAPKDMYKIE